MNSNVQTVLKVVSILALLAGCDSKQEEGLPKQQIAVSVAQQALGSGAISIDPFLGQNIRTPGIYRFVLPGEVKQICEFDTTLQSAISEMRSEEKASTEILEDRLANGELAVTIPFVEWSIPYKKIKVSGYKTRRVYSGDSGSSEEWIIKNVGENCSDILDRNRPYVVVTAVSIAENVETISGGGLSINSFVAGPASISASLADTVPQRRRGRVFAIDGQVVR